MFAFLILLCLCLSLVTAEVNGYCDVEVNGQFQYESSKKYNNKGYKLQCQAWGEQCRNKVCPFPKTEDTAAIIANCSAWSTCRCSWGYKPTKSTDGRACGMTGGMVAFIVFMCILVPLMCCACCCFFAHAAIIGVVGIGCVHCIRECYRSCCMDKEAANQARIRELEAQEAISGQYGPLTGMAEPLYDSNGNLIYNKEYSPLSPQDLDDDRYIGISAPQAEVYMPPSSTDGSGSYDSGGLSMHNERVKGLLGQDSQA